MDTEHATSSHLTIEHTPGGLRVAMRAPRALPLVVFLSVWLAGWTFGGIEALRAVSRADTLLNPLSLFLLVWIAGWALGEAAVIAFIAFLLRGAEIVTVDDALISLRAEAFGYGFTRIHDLAHATNLRPVAGDSSSSRDLLAFDFAGGTVRFGTSLNETDALQVARAIWERAPSLRPLSEPHHAEERAAR